MILFALAATLIYLLSHSLILVAVHQPRNNDFPLQRALQDQFMNGHTRMRVVQKTESDQVGFDVTIPDDSNDLEEQYEAKIAEQGNEEVEESLQTFEDQEFNEQEERIPIDLVDESGQEELLQSRVVLSKTYDGVI
jgi:maltodextrin utilization protein YvdJ